MRLDANGKGADCGAARARWVAKYRASGVGLKRFARENGLEAGQLHYWVYGAGQARDAAAKPLFREVRVGAPVPMTPAWSAEIVLAEGTRVRLSCGADVAWVSALVESLRQPCSP